VSYAGRRCVTLSMRQGARRVWTERSAAARKRGQRSASARRGRTGVSDPIWRSGDACRCLTRLSGRGHGTLPARGQGSSRRYGIEGVGLCPCVQDERLPVVSGFRINEECRARVERRPAGQRGARVRTDGHTGPGMRQGGTTARMYDALGRGLACGVGAAVPFDGERGAAYRGERSAARRVSEGGARCRHRRLQL